MNCSNYRKKEQTSLYNEDKFIFPQPCHDRLTHLEACIATSNDKSLIETLTYNFQNCMSKLAKIDRANPI